MLSQESLARIDREVAKYPADQKQSAVMAALRIAQEERGWLSDETIDCVARYLGMPAIATRIGPPSWIAQSGSRNPRRGRRP